MSKFKIFIQKVGSFIRETFVDIVDILEAKAPQAVRLTQLVKIAIEEHNGEIEWVLKKLKSDGMDELYIFAKDNLPKLAKELAIVDGLVSPNTSNMEAWKAYTDYLASKSKKARVKEIIIFSAEILGMIIGNKNVPIQALIIATQRAYQMLFGKD